MTRHLHARAGRDCRGAAGFTLVEVLLALAILTIAAVPMLYVTATAQRLARSQSDASDLQQRVRVAAEKLHRDLSIAGAGPTHVASVGPLANYFPPVVPARLGIRTPDPDGSAFDDRITVFYVPDGGWQAPLLLPLAAPDAAIQVDTTAAGCPGAGVCGFVEGTRAVILDPSATGAGRDVFSVTGVTGEIAHAPPNTPFSKLYAAGTSVVMPVVQRVYYFDRPTRRLMLYDGYQSDVPFIDNVVHVSFTYFGQGASAPDMRPLTLAELCDGPFVGSLAPFDADLLSIRLIRVVLRLQAGADDLRGSGPRFTNPGRSSSPYSDVPDFEVSFDVVPRNLRRRTVPLP